ncbi:MAG: phosphatidylserine/phosphatidylglycerophosphate/cardiolipin synthase family protein [Proteobacteria bacterium]|nr:MAG: phosphatidylserine/phosphatidylglycerophosphate/cardiolipin synthase family protein [Pseudomonadota bacterium]
MGWSKVEYLETGDSYYAALLKEFAGAKKSVLMECYIFQMDSVGRALLEALSECQGRGLRVFLRLDGIGSRPDLSEIAAFCHERHVELEVFHPLPFAPLGTYHSVGFAKADSFLNRLRLMNRRSHRKIAIVDETIGFTGGRNVDEVQSEKVVGKEAWHDLSLRLEGDGVQELLQAFLFRPVHKKQFKDCLVNYSSKLRRDRNNWLAKQMKDAKKRLWITTPYFAPTPRMLLELRKAAKDGVDIRLILTKKIDVLVSQLAARGLYRQLIRWGIKVYEYQPSLLHRKMWVIDDLGIVGSANFNHRSLVHDLEIDVILRDPAVVSEAMRLSLEDQNASRAISLEDMAKVNFVKRFLSWIAGWFSYWL